MRYLLAGFLMLTAMGMAWSPALALPAEEPRAMTDEMFEGLDKGYNYLSATKLSEAQAEFEKIIKADFYNPYANNNMAVIMEKQGRLPDAMTYLNIGEKFASHYMYEGSPVYLIGGVCAAVNPTRTLAETSIIAKIIAGNKKKLTEKMGPPAAAGSEPAGQ